MSTRPQRAASRLFLTLSLSPDMLVIHRSGSVLRTTSLTFVDVGAFPVALCTAVALGMALRSGSRCYHENPDVRRKRWTLHEPLPAEEVAVAGQAWRAAAQRRHLGRDTCNVSCWSVFGLRRPDAVEEFFPETALRDGAAHQGVCS